MQVKLSQVKSNPFNERKKIEQGTLVTLEGLTKTMKKRGWFGSLLCRKKGNKYEAAFGSLRLKAAKTAGINEVEIEVQDISDKEMRELTVIENVQRSDVNPMDRANHLKAYKDKYGYSERDLAKVFGIPQKTINQWLVLAELSSGAQELVKNREIGPRKAQIAYDIGGNKMVKEATKENWRKMDLEDMKTAVNKMPPKEREHKVKQVLEGAKEPWEIATNGLRHVKIEKEMDSHKMAMKLNNKIKDATEAIKVLKKHWSSFDGSDQLILNLSLGVLDKNIHETAEKMHKEYEIEPSLDFKALMTAK